MTLFMEWISLASSPWIPARREHPVAPRPKVTGRCHRQTSSTAAVASAGMSKLLIAGRMMTLADITAPVPVSSMTGGLLVTLGRRRQEDEPTCSVDEGQGPGSTGAVVSRAVGLDSASQLSCRFEIGVRSCSPYVAVPVTSHLLPQNPMKLSLGIFPSLFSRNLTLPKRFFDVHRQPAAPTQKTTSPRHIATEIAEATCPVARSEERRPCTSQSHAACRTAQIAF
jgi:hypothetical protein